MFTKITTIEELKEIFVESLLDSTNNVTSVAEGSVLNGIAFGNAKIGQKVIKDIAVIEAHLFADSAYGVYLDDLARLKGIAPRFTSTGSSTYVRLSGVPGTVYTVGVQTFTGNHGIIFDLEVNVTIPNMGWTYTKVKSQTSGLSTNVNPLTLNQCIGAPIGHLYVINEYLSTGGRDNEDDTLFRKRIKEEVNLLAKSTLSFLEQVFKKINPNVLRVLNYGYNNVGTLILCVVSQNGVNFTNNELDEIYFKGEQYFALTELRPDGFSYYQISLVNASWYPIDVSFRVDLEQNVNIDEVRKNIQLGISKALDYRFWKNGNRVEWDDLLEIVKRTPGVKYVPDVNFFPNLDIFVTYNFFPRLRGFLMLDLAGNIIANYAGTLNPIFYPSESDFSFQSTVLASI